MLSNAADPWRRQSGITLARNVHEDDVGERHAICRYLRPLGTRWSPWIASRRLNSAQEPPRCAVADVARRPKTWRFEWRSTAESSSPFHAPVIPAETFRRHRATPSAHAQPCHSSAPLACAAVRIRKTLRLGHTGAAPAIHSQSQSPAPAPSPAAIHALRMTVRRAMVASPYRRPASKISANPRRRTSRSA